MYISEIHIYMYVFNLDVSDIHVHFYSIQHTEIDEALANLEG